MDRQNMTNQNAGRSCPGQQIPSLMMVLAGVVCLSLASGCQSTQEHGLLRVWADVNSLGGPAAFVDQFRTGSFRRSVPPTGLPVVETLDVHPALLHTELIQSDLIPLSDPIGSSPDNSGSAVPLCPPESPTDDAGDISQTVFQPGSYPRNRPRPASASQSTVVVPQGAWLF